MALSFKTGTSYGFQILKLFGVSEALINQVEAAGMTIEQPSPGSFCVSNGSTKFGHVPITGKAITLAQNGELGPASKKAIQFQFEQAITKALKETSVPLKTVMVSSQDMSQGDLDVSTDDDAVDGPMTLGKLLKAKLKNDAVTSIAGSTVKVDASSGTGASTIASSKAFPSVSVSMNLPEVEKALKKAPVTLAVADTLYQPVVGTSSGSVYHVIGLFSGLQVACRIKNGHLSIRAEGNQLSDYKNRLMSIGMEVKPTYASVHLSVVGDDLLHKTMGAVIGALGFSNAQKLGDVGFLIGKGA